MPQLVIRSGVQAGRTVQLETAATLGRGSSADLDLGDPTVSRKHAHIAPRNGAWLLTDLGSPNGTYVQGRRLTAPVILEGGTLFRLGNVEIQFDSAAAEEEEVADHSVGTPSVIMRMPATLARGLPGAEAGFSERLEFLSELALSLGRTFNEEALLKGILEKLFELLPQAERGLILLGDGEHLVPRASRSRKGEPVTTTSRTLLREVIEKREGIVSADAMGDTRFSGAGSMTDIGIRSLLCVPVVDETEVYGVIQLDSTRPGFPFKTDDLALLLVVARQLALALANARLHAQLVEQELMQHDLMLAAKVQQRFLPRTIPVISGCEIAVEYASALQVGGDFYAFLNLDGGRLGVAVGDVSGKGVSAALCMARIMSDLRYHSVGETEPASILSRLNVALCGDLDEGMFVTMMLVTFDPVAAELRVARAGHPPPFVCEGEGTVVTLAAGEGPAIGFDPGAKFDQRVYTLDRNDVIVLYTDGVTEALDRAKQTYGESRLAKAMASAPRTALGVRETVLADVQAFSGGEPQADDLTLVCLGVV